MFRRAISLSVSLVVLLSVGACGAAPVATSSAPSAAAVTASPVATQRPLLTLRVGLGSTPAPALPNSVLWLAKDLGYYEREGLDVSLIELNGTPAVIAAMRSGDLDVGNIATSDVLNLTASKTLELRAIHSPDSRQYFMVVTKDTIGTVADLKGRSFGIARVGSLDHTMTSLVLKAKGFDPADLKFVGAGDPSARAQALVAGRLDATAVSLGTWVSIQKEKGIKALIDSNEYYAAAPIIVKVNAVTPKVAAEKAEQLKRFSAAVMKASRAFAADQKTWVDAMAKRRTDLARVDLEGLWPQFSASWASNGILNLDQYAKTADFLYSTDDFKGIAKIGPADWVDTRFVDAALKEIGVAAGVDDPGRPIR